MSQFHVHGNNRKIEYFLVAVNDSTVKSGVYSFVLNCGGGGGRISRRVDILLDFHKVEGW